MILAMDIGNTNIKCGLFSNGKLEHSFKMSSNADMTSDEYAISMLQFFEYLHLSADNVDGVILSSVIPSINYTIEHMAEFYFKLKPMVVGPGIKTGIQIRYDNPHELGSDRIVNAVGAYDLFGGPVITIDFGTATTFGAISQTGEFLGGSICPGLKISADALTSCAARLPRIELVRPSSVINTNTISSMQAGIIYGYVGQVHFILEKMKQELGAATVVATGGFSELISAETHMIDEVIPTLTLIGLERIYTKNKPV